MATTYDPFNEADTAQAAPSTRHYFGSMLVDAWPAVLVKGQGKVPYNPQVHTEDQRITAIQLVLTPLPHAGVPQYQVQRDLIVQSNDWTKIVRPSLEKLGIKLQQLHGRWVHAETVETGSYIKKTTGEEKTKTMLRFLEVFDSQAACQTACDAFFSGRRSGQTTQQAPVAQAPAPTPQAPSSAPANGTGRDFTSDARKADPNYGTALKFLPALWKNAVAGGPADTVLERFLTGIRSNGLTSRFFDATSPEVTDIVLAHTSS